MRIDSAYYLHHIQNNISSIPKPSTETFFINQPKITLIETPEISFNDEKSSNSIIQIKSSDITASKSVKTKDQKEWEKQESQIDLQRSNFQKYA